MMRLSTLFFAFICLSISVATAQYEVPDSTALEDVFVEIYYISDTLDVLDEDGGHLDTCSVTYRVYVDMKPGYEIQAVYGNENNLLQIETSSVFFNNEDRGEESGDVIGDNYLGDNTVALDSWVTMGGASESHWGVPKILDDDGSLIGGDNSDGGSEEVPGGILVAEHEDMGLLLTVADGLIEGEVPTVTAVGIELDIFADENEGTTFETNSGAWSVLEGAVGPTEENQVLIGQFTTQGEFSYKLNIQIGIPEELQCGHPDCHSTIQYVAELSDEDAAEGVDTDNIFYHPALSFVSEPVICFTDTDISVAELQVNTTINVFPNPVQDHFTVEVENVRFKNAELRVYDSLGALHMIEYLSGNAGRQTYKVDTSSWHAGVYMIVVQANGNMTTKEIIVQ